MPPFAEHSSDFRDRRRRVGKIFQYLRADYEIELLVPKRQRLSRGSNIHEWSRLQVNRNVASGSRLQQRTIRLQPSPNIEHAQPALWQAIQSRLENPPPPAQDQPIRISQRGMQSLSTLPLNLLQVSQISQTFLENRLLRLIQFVRIIAQEFLKHKLQQRFQTYEASPKPLFRGCAQFLRQADFSSGSHCESEDVLPIAPRIRPRIAPTIILSSSSSPPSNAMPQNDA